MIKSYKWLLFTVLIWGGGVELGSTQVESVNVGTITSTITNQISAIGWQRTGADVTLFTATDQVGFGLALPTTAIHMFASVVNNPILQIESDQDGSSGGILRFFLDNDGSPADEDLLGLIGFNGDDDGGTETVFSEIRGNSVDVTNGDEAGSLTLRLIMDGAFRTAAIFKGYNGTVGQAQTTFNDDSQDWDTVFESDISTHALAIIGSNGFVGHNTSAPAAFLHLNRTTAADAEIRLQTTVTTAQAWDIETDDTDGSLDFVDITGSAAVEMSLETNGNFTLGNPPAPGGQVHVYSATGSDIYLFETEDPGGFGGTIRLLHDSTSPAAGDGLGSLSWRGDDSAGNETEYGFITMLSKVVTNGSESGEYAAIIQNNTVLDTFMVHRGGSSITVFNPNSKNIDFNIESDNNANLVYIDGANDRFGMGTATPTEDFHFTAPDGTEDFMIETTDAGSNAATLVLFKNTATEADGDEIGELVFRGTDDNPVAISFGRIVGIMSDVSEPNHGGDVNIEVAFNGTLQEIVSFSGYNGTQNQGQVVFNEPGNDVDTRFEASGITAALFVQGSNGGIGVNNSSPLGRMEITDNDNVSLYLSSDEDANTGDADNIIVFRINNTSNVFALGYNEGSDNFEIDGAGALDASPFLSIDQSTGAVVIGSNTATTDALLEVVSTTAAFMLPRMTTAQRDALTGANGMMIYNTTTNAINGFENGSWVDL